MPPVEIVNFTTLLKLNYSCSALQVTTKIYNDKKDDKSTTIALVKLQIETCSITVQLGSKPQVLVTVKSQGIS